MQTQNSINNSERAVRNIARLKRHIEQSAAALNWLAVEGFQPLSIVSEGERRAPILQIALSPRVALLKNSHKAWRHSITADSTTWRADIMGCRVQWTERGH